MFGSAVLETMVGLAFVYFFLSIVVSAANEALATLLGLRARTLVRGLQALLHDPGSSKIVGRLLEHPLIQGLSLRGKPSYIPARNFAAAFLDLALPNRPAPGTTPAALYTALSANVPPELMPALKALVEESKGDWNRLGESLEGWFNGSMDRVSGWYKRRIMVMTFLLGALVSVALNADTLALMQRLYGDSALRSAVLQAADESVQQGTPASSAAAAGPGATVQNLLDQAGQFPGLLGDWSLPPENSTGRAAWWFRKILGLLLTSLALSMGTPFWFDAIGKLVPLRGTGNKPAAPPPASA